MQNHTSRNQHRHRHGLMNNRTKYLLVSLSVIGIGLVGDQGYRRFVEAPAARNQRELSRLQTQIAKATDVITSSVAAADELLALENCSLPYDQELARARYQDWLLSLVQQVGLKQASVDSSSPLAITIKDRITRKPKEIYKRYSFSLHGRGSLSQVTQLLYEFYRGGHLHKIRTLILNPLAGGTQLDLTMNVEAIGLMSCHREDGLSTARVNRLAFDSREDYQDIVRRNFFSREIGSSLTRVVLTAVTFDKTGRPEAWFSIGANQPTKKMHRGESMNVFAHTIEVVDIHPYMVLIEVDGSVVRVRLGGSVQAGTAT